MTCTPETEFRHWDDPRRHVPRLVYIHDHAEHPRGVWQLSVRDHKNQHHVRCMDTWIEAKTTATQWAHVNEAHGCRIYTDSETISWAD